MKKEFSGANASENKGAGLSYELPKIQYTIFIPSTFFIQVNSLKTQFGEGTFGSFAHRGWNSKSDQNQFVTVSGNASQNEWKWKATFMNNLIAGVYKVDSSMEGK